MVNAIDWSKGLDHVFIDNYNRDPSLSWQVGYFVYFYLFTIYN